MKMSKHEMAVRMFIAAKAGENELYPQHLMLLTHSGIIEGNMIPFPTKEEIKSNKCDMLLFGSVVDLDDEEKYFDEEKKNFIFLKPAKVNLGLYHATFKNGLMVCVDDIIGFSSGYSETDELTQKD